MTQDEGATAAPLSDRPREGHPTVTIETNVDTAWAGCGAVERHEVDAAWWDAQTEDDREEYLTEVAREVLAQHASSGASVVGRSDQAGGA